MNRMTLWALPLLGLPLVCQAIEPGPSLPYQQEAERWINLQPSGQYASRIPQTQTPAEREKAMYRWLDAYKYEYPDWYRWEKVKQD